VEHRNDRNIISLKQEVYGQWERDREAGLEVEQEAEREGNATCIYCTNRAKCRAGTMRMCLCKWIGAFGLSDCICFCFVCGSCSFCLLAASELLMQSKKVALALLYWYLFCFWIETRKINKEIHHSVGLIFLFIDHCNIFSNI